MNWTKVFLYIQTKYSKQIEVARKMFENLGVC